MAFLHDIFFRSEKKIDSSTSAIRSVTINSLVSERFNRIEVAYPDTTSEVYTYKYDTTVVGTVTVTYGDVAKTVLISVVSS